MRYTLKYFNGKDVINHLFTNDLSALIKEERKLRKIYGEGNVWFADAILEILVG